MHKPQKNDLLELDIEDIGYEGGGIGKTNGNFAVFVPYTVPGDKVQAIIVKSRKNLAEGKLVKIITPSESRLRAECRYFGTCNGCRMQHISYKKQLEIKRNNVFNSFERIGNFKNAEVNNITGSENEYFYRNKLEFSFSANRWLDETDMQKDNPDKSFALGFHKPGFIDKVIDIESCLLQSELSNNILNFTREFFKKRDISVYSTRTNGGFLRFLVIRQSANTKDIMVNIITSEHDANLMNDFSENLSGMIFNSLKPQLPDRNNLTIINSISSRKANVAQAERIFLLLGKGYIEEKLGNFRFKISPFSFFQTNTKQCEKLFENILKLGEFGKDENVLDLYCGCGAISIYISAHVKSVHGVELSTEAIESASENAAINNIINCSFEAGDVKDFLSSAVMNITGPDRYDTFIIDPPRSGIHPKASELILNLKPNKIIYVSCNPATQARDIRMLSDSYKIISLQPVDMFPHTNHIENIARLDLKNEK